MLMEGKGKWGEEMIKRGKRGRENWERDGLSVLANICFFNMLPSIFSLGDGFMYMIGLSS